MQSVLPNYYYCYYNSHKHHTFTVITDTSTASTIILVTIFAATIKSGYEKQFILLLVL